MNLANLRALFVLRLRSGLLGSFESVLRDLKMGLRGPSTVAPLPSAAGLLGVGFAMSSSDVCGPPHGMSIDLVR